MKDIKNISELHEWKDNPRNITEKDFERLKGQIKKLGQYKPLLVTKDGEVIGGNMRLKAYNELGIKDIWVSVVEPKDENEKLEYALSDNDRAGYYDDDLLANLIPNYDIDWSQYAVDLKPPEDIQKLIDRIAPVEEDEAPEVSEGEAVSKLGEVYSLGRHRLMCGDSTKIEDVEKLMDGKKADMVFTDPPYGVGYEYNEHKDVGGKEYEDLVISYMDICLVISPFVVVTCGKSNEVIYFKKYKIIDSAVWNKKFAATRGNCYHAMITEPILFFGKKPNNKFLDTDLLEIMTDREKELRLKHSCPKPIKLPAEIIKTFTNDNGSVLDVFGGSGSTLIACEQTNRICYMMELDPKYCDVIRKRYAKFIGKEDSWETITPKL